MDVMRRREGKRGLTEFLYHVDSYVREFDAIVENVAEAGVVLNRTAFYPGGGGQPHDVGVLRRARDGAEMAVRRISMKGGVPFHEVEGGGLAPGDAVTGIIEWERRYQLMRTHTALHILCGVIWRDYGAPVTGGDIKPLRARMDFELESMSTDLAAEIERRANAEVVANRPVKVSILPREQAFQIPDLIRTKINLLPQHIAEVRVVDISGLDMQADGGTHVGRTGEVGRIRVVGHESKGRINKRLRIELDAADI